MSKTSNNQKLAVLKIWLDDLKNNYKYRQQKKQKASKWLEELDDEN